MNKKLKCILLVDDDEPTNFLNKMLIERSSCAETVSVAQGGEAALEYLLLAESNKDTLLPDLILLDINMPAMNGWEFLSRYNMTENISDNKCVIVMLSTTLNPDDRLQAEKLPVVSGFESKPLTRE